MKREIRFADKTNRTLSLMRSAFHTVLKITPTKKAYGRKTRNELAKNIYSEGPLSDWTEMKV